MKETLTLDIDLYYILSDETEWYIVYIKIDLFFLFLALLRICQKSNNFVLFPK